MIDMLFVLHDPYNEKAFRMMGIQMETIPELMCMKVKMKPKWILSLLKRSIQWPPKLRNTVTKFSVGT